MNNSTDSNGFLSSNDIGGFGYGIGVSVGILLLITTITLASYFCTRTVHQQSERPNYRNSDATAGQNETSTEFVVVDVGLDEATINGYPKMAYSEAKLRKKDSTAACCSVCLADYKAADMLRELPDCGHLFHVKCIDPWLRLNPTCPVCRTSPIPTPLPTPLAEVVPLATRRDG